MEEVTVIQHGQVFKLKAKVSTAGRCSRAGRWRSWSSPRSISGSRFRTGAATLGDGGYAGGFRASAVAVVIAWI
jgi:hypothetical protein